MMQSSLFEVTTSQCTELKSDIYEKSNSLIYNLNDPFSDSLSRCARKDEDNGGRSA